MKITFFTNFINHHQVPVADELYDILGSDYTFVSTMPITEERLRLGYPDFSDKPYLLNAYESKENYQKAMDLALSSDVVILGAAPDTYIYERLKKNKLTFRYSERWFKQGYKHLFHPKFWINIFKNYYPFINKQYYMLCASAYTKKDVNLLGLFKNKCFKWGYFPKLNLDNCIEPNKSNDITNFIWVGRFLDWKHPELSIKLINELKNKGYKVHLTIIGIGSLEEELKSLTQSLNLKNEISFLGSLPNQEVIDNLRQSDVLLFTSDKNEGWGAILNEAMANKCAVIASNEIGSVPYLLNHNENGLVFKSNNLKDLTNKAEFIINNPEIRINFANNAYETISLVWSPKNAVDNFLKLINNLNSEKVIEINNGPCSKA